MTYRLLSPPQIVLVLPAGALALGDEVGQRLGEPGVEGLYLGDEGLGVEALREELLFEEGDDLAAEPAAVPARALLEAVVDGAGDVADGEGGHGRVRMGRELPMGWRRWIGVTPMIP